MKYIWYVVCIILIYVLQTVYIPLISLNGISANLPLIMVIIIASVVSKNEAVIVACIIGVIFDLSYFKIFGQNTFLFILISIVVNLSYSKILKENTFLMSIMLILGTIACETLFFIFNIGTLGTGNFLSCLFGIILPETAFNFVIGIILYRILIKTRLLEPIRVTYE